jgi:hypothetical protein
MLLLPFLGSSCSFLHDLAGMLALSIPHRDNCGFLVQVPRDLQQSNQLSWRAGEFREHAPPCTSTPPVVDTGSRLLASLLGERWVVGVALLTPAMNVVGSGSLSGVRNFSRSGRSEFARNFRPNASRSARPSSSHDSALSRLKPPASIRVPR